MIYNKVLTDFPKKNWSWMLVVLSVIADITALIQWLKGYTHFLNFIILALGIIILWLSLLYIYLKKTKVGELFTEAKGCPPRIVRRPLYSILVRRFTLVGILIIPISTITAFSIWKHIQNLPTDKLVILIADFDGPFPKNYRVTETIIDHMHDATKQNGNIKIKTLGHSITAQEGSEVAKAMGKKHKASIILWGWYGKTKEEALVTIHFEVLRKLRYLPLLQKREIIRVVATDIERFEIQLRLSREMSYLALLTSGLERYEAEDYDAAISLFNAAIDQSVVPENFIHPAVAYFRRGSAYLAKGNLDSAIIDLDKAIDLKHNYAEAYNNRGSVYYSNQDYNKARLDYDKAILFNTNAGLSFAYYYNRGNTYAKSHDSYSAILDYDKAIELEPNYPNLYINRGNAHLSQHNYGNAISDYNKAMKLNSDDVNIYLNRGIAYYFNGHFTRALADIDRTIKQNPNDSHAFYYRGCLYKDKGQYEQAIADFEQAILINYNYVDAHYKRLLVYHEIGKLHKAIAELNTAINHKSNEALNYYYRGLACKIRGSLNKAIADFGHAIDLNLDDATVYFNRGKAFLVKGDQDRAINDFRYALKLKPYYIEAYVERGLAYHSKGDYDNAIVDYNQYIKYRKRDSEVYKYRGLAYAKKGDLDLGTPYYNKPIKEQPAPRYSGEFNFAIGFNYISDAIRDFTRAIELNPAVPSTYYNRGLAYYSNGDYDRAINNYDQAIKLKSDYVDAYYDRGRACFKTGYLERAVADFDQVIKLQPNHALAYLTRGLVFCYSDYKRAVSDLNQAFKLKPALAKNQDYGTVFNNIAWQFALHNEQLEVALYLSKRSLRLSPKDPNYWDTLAEIYYRLAQFSDSKIANNKAKIYAKEANVINSIQERSKKIKSKLLVHK